MDNLCVVDQGTYFVREIKRKRTVFVPKIGTLREEDIQRAFNSLPGGILKVKLIPAKDPKHAMVVMISADTAEALVSGQLVKVGTTVLKCLPSKIAQDSSAAYWASLERKAELADTPETTIASNIEFTVTREDGVPLKAPVGIEGKTNWKIVVRNKGGACSLFKVGQLDRVPQFEVSKPTKGLLIPFSIFLSYVARPFPLPPPFIVITS
jgi:hypothetical protein